MKIILPTTKKQEKSIDIKNKIKNKMYYIEKIII